MDQWHHSDDEDELPFGIPTWVITLTGLVFGLVALAVMVGITT